MTVIAAAQRVTAEPLPVRVALFVGLAALALTGIAAIATLMVRLIVQIRKRRVARAIAKWRPLFGEAISGGNPVLPMLRPKERVPVLVLWNHLQESLRGSIRGTLVDVAKTVGVDQAARAMLRHKDLGENLIGAVTLGNLADGRAWDRLLQLAGDDRAVLASAAARALIRIDPTRAVYALAPVLTARTDWHPARVTSLLIEAGGEAAAAALTPLIANAADADIPRLVRYLESTRNTTVLPLIRLRLQSATDPEAIAAELHALGELRDPTDARYVRLLVAHESAAVRTQAAIALGRLGSRDDVALLEAMLDDPEWWVRYRAARALVALPYVDNEQMERIVRQHSSEKARAIMAHAIAEASFA